MKPMSPKWSFGVATTNGRPSASMLSRFSAKPSLVSFTSRLVRVANQAVKTASSIVPALRIARLRSSRVYVDQSHR